MEINTVPTDSGFARKNNNNKSRENKNNKCNYKNVRNVIITNLLIIAISKSIARMAVVPRCFSKDY